MLIPAAQDGETAISPLDRPRLAVACPPNHEMELWNTALTEHIDVTLNRPPLAELRLKRAIDKKMEANENHELGQAPKAERSLNKAALELLNRLERDLENM